MTFLTFQNQFEHISIVIRKVVEEDVLEVRPVYLKHKGKVVGLLLGTQREGSTDCVHQGGAGGQRGPGITKPAGYIKLKTITRT